MHNDIFRVTAEECLFLLPNRGLTAKAKVLLAATPVRRSQVAKSENTVHLQHRLALIFSFV